MGKRSADAGIGRPPSAWLVWSGALLAYVVAVVQRSSFGVAGLVGAERFGVDATTLSLFAVIQITMYALMQVPAGVAMDRWGPRRLLMIGSVTMAVGQLAMAFAPSIGVALAARVLIGAGDAGIFVSAVRLVAAWFDRRRVPLLTQLTGIVGQMGQIASAIPFAWALHRFGWTSAFATLAAVGALAAAGAWLAVRDTPPSTVTDAPRGLTGLGDTLRHPGTWLGYWSHMLGGTSGTVIVLMWGVPFLVEGQGVTPGQASALLTLNVVVGVLAGPLVGEFTARHPLRRSWAVLAVAAGTAVGWAIVLLPSTPRPMWQLVAFVGLVSIGGPTSLIGLDFARTSNPPQRLGAAQAVTNMGGFTLAVPVMLIVGMVLDHRAPSGSPSLTDYRAALSVIVVPLVVSVVGVLVTRPRTRVATGVVVPPVAEAWARYRQERLESRAARRG